MAMIEGCPHVRGRRFHYSAMGTSTRKKERNFMGFLCPTMGIWSLHFSLLSTFIRAKSHNSGNFHI